MKHVWVTSKDLTLDPAKFGGRFTQKNTYSPWTKQKLRWIQQTVSNWNGIVYSNLLVRFRPKRLACWKVFFIMIGRFIRLCLWNRHYRSNSAQTDISFYSPLPYILGMTCLSTACFSSKNRLDRKHLTISNTFCQTRWRFWSTTSVRQNCQSELNPVCPVNWKRFRIFLSDQAIPDEVGHLVSLSVWINSIPLKFSCSFFKCPTPVTVKTRLTDYPKKECCLKMRMHAGINEVVRFF